MDDLQGCAVQLGGRDEIARCGADRRYDIRRKRVIQRGVKIELRFGIGRGLDGVGYVVQRERLAHGFKLLQIA